MEKEPVGTAGKCPRAYVTWTGGDEGAQALRNSPTTTAMDTAIRRRCERLRKTLCVISGETRPPPRLVPIAPVSCDPRYGGAAQRWPRTLNEAELVPVPP